MPDYKSYIDSISILQGQAQRCHQRRMVIISGTRDWCQGLAEAVHEQVSNEQSLWVSQSPLESQRGINPSKAHMLLGSEIDLLVIDCHSGLDANALAASAGALRGGGLLLLLTPPWQRWSLLDGHAGAYSLFINHIQSSLETAGFTHFREGEEPPTIRPELDPVLAVSYEEQQQAIAAIIKVSQGHRRRPLVITADRGRGKSSALGLASAALMQLSPLRIIVTAPRSESVLPVFSHAALALGIDQHTGLLAYEHATLEFIAPDELIRAKPVADLLLVDEAAAIPAPMLATMLQRYSRIVFSTTVHGYEGTGRGFTIRFRKVLDAQTPQWKSFYLNQPIRWAQDDPVEEWLFNALQLNAAVLPASELGEIDLKKVKINRLDRQQLVAENGLLSQIFGLLVLAHYQTSPNDLRMLLDDPAVAVWVTCYGDAVLAAALVVKEGGIEESVAQAIWLGKRRQHGHMLPQVLSAQCGFKEAAGFHYWRVMRIAVHPDFQGRELGSKLLRAISQQALAEKIDLLGSSFAATPDVLDFWSRAGFNSVRLGITRDACSGAHSMLVIKGVSADGKDFGEILLERFAEQLPWQLPDSLKDIEPELVNHILSGLPVSSLPVMSAQDWLDVKAYTEGGRAYDSCALPVWKFLLSQFILGRVQQQLTPTRQGVLSARILQRKPWPEVIAAYSLKGKKQAEQLLREGVARLSREIRK